MLQVSRASYIKILTPPACNSASSFKMLKTNFPNLNFSIFYLYFLNIIKFPFNILTFYFQTIHFYFLSANLASILFTCIIMNSFYLFQQTFLNNGLIVEGEVWSLKSKWKRAGGGENYVKKNWLIFQTANRVPSDKLLGSCWKFY